MSDPSRPHVRVRSAHRTRRYLPMNMHAMKTEPDTAANAVAIATTAAPVVAMTPKRPPRAEKYTKMAKETAVRVVPPLIVLALGMLFWELVCQRAGSPP